MTVAESFDGDRASQALEKVISSDGGVHLQIEAIRETMTDYCYVSDFITSLKNKLLGQDPAEVSGMEKGNNVYVISWDYDGALFLGILCGYETRTDSATVFGISSDNNDPRLTPILSEEVIFWGVVDTQSELNSLDLI